MKRPNICMVQSPFIGYFFLDLYFLRSHPKVFMRVGIFNYFSNIIIRSTLLGSMTWLCFSLLLPYIELQHKNIVVLFLPLAIDFPVQIFPRIRIILSSETTCLLRVFRKLAT